jgi:hypothetical protein
MNQFRKKFVIAIMLIALGTLCQQTARAQLTVIGNWENGSSDGWFDWTDQLSVNDPAEIASGKYSFSNTTGVTLGNSSLLVTASGYDQDLSIKLQNNPSDALANHADLRPAFFANKAFAIDITYPAYSTTDNASGGYQQMYEVDLNTQSYGFKDAFAGNAPIASTEVGFQAGVATPAVTRTLSFNYGSLIGTGSGQIQTTDSYVEMILATNGDSTHDLFYFDNARFYTPGDMNNDGHVDGKDIAAMEAALTNPAAYQSTYFNGNSSFVLSDLATLGDVNGDGVFNIFDLQSLLTNLKAGKGSVASVPEPTSIVLLSLAIPGLVLVTRCRSGRSKQS